MSVLGTLMRPVFQVQPKDLPPLTAGSTDAAQRLQQVVYTVTECCELTLTTRNPRRLVELLDQYPDELRGFAYEGAGVALSALDQIAPWTCRTATFTRDYATPYKYAIYLGAGMGLARIRRNPTWLQRRLSDDVYHWVVLDGFGFHEGFFAHRRYVQEQRLPPWVSGYARRAFDHGLGRSLWFATGADPDRLARTIDGFPRERQGDLWAGIGLACGYTGGVPEPTLRTLRAAAAAHLDRLAEGVVVAAKNRHEVGNTATHNDLASLIITGLRSGEAADAAQAALTGLRADDIQPAYEVWRARLRELPLLSLAQPAD